MQVQIDKLRAKPFQLDLNEQASAFAELACGASAKGFDFLEPICGRLEVTRSNDLIKVAGHLSTRVALACGRCLVKVESPLSLELDLVYALKASVESDEPEELELARSDLDLLTVEGEVLDLKSEVEQEIIMALPHQLMCHEQCSGLCPVCGCNLNQKSCDCERPVFHSGLAALKDFKIDS
ncbi:MAG: DUF177 domain-containing protein [Desulfuromonadales bacterium]|nr:DUF177 domain-containing protein [Desulfuromonadales bacterium]